MTRKQGNPRPSGRGGRQSRKGTAHRFVRDQTAIDVVASSPVQVDILVADHAAPRVVEKMRGYEMVKIEGGTQALRRTLTS